MTPRWGRDGTIEADPGERPRLADGPTVARIRPRLWPLVPERAPALSILRTARQAARLHPDGQGLVVAFSGAPVDHLHLVIGDATQVRLAGGRQRPVFVALEPGAWSLSAGVAGATGYKHFTRYDVAIEGARHRQIELVWFRVERFQLSCDITTIRPGAAHPAWEAVGPGAAR